MHWHVGIGLQRHLRDQLGRAKNPFRQKVKQKFSGLAVPVGRLVGLDEKGAGARLEYLLRGSTVQVRPTDLMS